jgi:hypothetical protein
MKCSEIYRPLPPPVITATSPGTLKRDAASIFEVLVDIVRQRLLNTKLKGYKISIWDSNRSG